MQRLPLQCETKRRNQNEIKEGKKNTFEAILVDRMKMMLERLIFVNISTLIQDESL